MAIKMVPAGTIRADEPLSPASVMRSSMSAALMHPFRMFAVFTHGMSPPQYAGLAREGVPPETILAISPSRTTGTFARPSLIPALQPLSLFVLELLGAGLGRGQILRHGAADVLDGLADAAADVLVGLVGRLLALGLVAANRFRATQTEEKLRRDETKGKEAAN